MRVLFVICGMSPFFSLLITQVIRWMLTENSARIPQIIKNHREKSCEGLALLFFLLSLTGNLTYGASVVAYSRRRDYLVRALPWLLGSLGTVVEDCVIFVQFRLYAPERAVKAGGAV